DDIKGYNNRFHELALMCLDLVTPKKKNIERYVRGILDRVKANITSSKPQNKRQEAAKAYVATPTRGKIWKKDAVEEAPTGTLEPTFLEDIFKKLSDAKALYFYQLRILIYAVAKLEFEEDPHEEPEEDHEEEPEEVLELEVDDEADWDEKMNEHELIFPIRKWALPNDHLLSLLTLRRR
nr:hypothetical protein [Tanacetum cinerariifolium]